MDAAETKLEERVIFLEEQNAYLEKEITDNSTLIDQMNLVIHNIKEELRHLHNVIENSQGIDSTQEILHNGQNR